MGEVCSTGGGEANDPPMPKRPLPAPISDFYLEQSTSYLNCATLGPTPKSVLAAAVKEWEWLEQDPLNHYFGSGERGACSKMTRAQSACARFINCADDEMVLVPSTTVALNTVADGLLSSGFLAPSATGKLPTVLTTDQEHAGGENCWKHLVDLGKISYQAVELYSPQVCRAADITADQILAVFEKALTEAECPRVVFVSHVLTTSGLVMPLAGLAALTHAAGAVLIVDGAQAAGAIPVDVAALDCDAYTVSAHKWVLAPAGSGMLYIKKSLQPSVQSSFLKSGFAPYSASSGTRASHTIHALAGAIEYLERFGGMASISAYNRKLRARALAGLIRLKAKHIPALQIVSPPDGPLSGPLLTFAMPDGGTVSSGALAAELRSRGLVVKTGTFRAKNGSIRLSFHLYNTEADVDRLVRELAPAFVAAQRAACSKMPGGRM